MALNSISVSRETVSVREQQKAFRARNAANKQFNVTKEHAIRLIDASGNQIVFHNPGEHPTGRGPTSNNSGQRQRTGYFTAGESEWQHSCSRLQ